MPDAATADYLRSDGLRAVATNAGAAAWGTAAIESAVRCPFDALAAAQAEAARQIAFLGPSRVVDLVRVPGRRVDLIGRAVTITADSEGYRAGAVVFVIGADELDGEIATALQVIRRLA